MNDVWILIYTDRVIGGVFESFKVAEVHIRERWDTLYGPGSKGEPIFSPIDDNMDRIAIIDSSNDKKIATLTKRIVE